MKLKMRSTPTTPICIAILFAGFATNLLAQSFAVIDIPNAYGTWPISINARGDVTGYYCPNPGCLGPSRGFLYEANGYITVFDGIPTGINDAGVVTGYGYQGHNFLRDQAGNVTIFDVPPPNPLSPASSFPMTIDNRGDVAGYLVPCPGCDTYQAFVRTRSGAITTFVVPKGLVATGINARGGITGNTAPYYIPEDGFVRDRKGNITVFSVSDGPGPRAHCVSINNRGDVAGYFYDSSTFRLRGFLREFDGTVSVFDPAPNTDTKSASINERGDVAGDLSGPTGPRNFVRDQSGNVTVFDVPNSFTAHVAAISNSGDVTGYYYELRNGELVTRGFIRRAH